MSLSTQILESVSRMTGFSSETPRTVTCTAPEGVELAVDFTAIDSMSCSFRELRVRASALRDLPFTSIQEWGAAICARVTYLLERLAPLENDTLSETVLIRSSPPARQVERTLYYEVQVQAPGELRLRRVYNLAHEAVRQPVDTRLTLEALQKLVDDIAAAIPAGH